ncbi:FkbM family methyltransferase [Roseomonas sp. USHLN139]|uniref:FkbM family methyltransferase n=1 Tax=Roseomonas sp. USHLN139 TaxID=3081298 RepID=UPI003B01B69D
MSWMTSAAARQLRSGLRRTGLIRLAMLLLRRLGYEQLFTRALARVIRPGHCVWDVGANLGVYSAMFGRLAGPQGMVYAFEPLPETVARLRRNLGGAPGIRVMPFALSDSSGLAVLERGDDAEAATARLVDDAAAMAGTGGIAVPLRPGDTLVETGEARPPNVVKIDVEGHELAVLQGMRQQLADPALQHVFIEVHFALLHAEGRGDVPRQIEALLRDAGFALRWIDQSHLHAARG